MSPGTKKTRKTTWSEPVLRENTKTPEWKRTWILHFQKSQIGPVDLTIVLSISGRKCYEAFLFVCGLQEVKKINHWPLIYRQFTVCYLFIALRSNIFILLLWNFDLENLNICDVFFIHSARGSWSHKGCRVVKEKDQNVECACDHLTNFAILMQVKEFEVCSLFSVCNDSLEYKKSES